MNVTRSKDVRPGNQVARKGIAFISEALNLFINMSVQENLYMGAYIVTDKKRQKRRLEIVYELFPRLAERRHQLAGTMSGGERKMLAIGRGLMSEPTLLLVDEPVPAGNHSANWTADRAAPAGLFFARLIKAGVSRQREYLADASAVQFTRQTEGIAGALKKIGYGASSLI